MIGLATSCELQPSQPKAKPLSRNGGANTGAQIAVADGRLRVQRHGHQLFGSVGAFHFGYTLAFIGYGILPLLALVCIIFFIGPLRADARFQSISCLNKHKNP